MSSVRRISIFCLLACWVFCAQSVGEEISTPPEPGPSLSHAAITTSLTALLTPSYSLQVEIPIFRFLSASARGLGGSYGTAAFESVSFIGGGVSGFFYPFGDFRRGLRLGIDSEYARAWATSSVEKSSGNRFRLGALVGGKWTARSGFVCSASAGLASRWEYGSSYGLRTIPYSDWTIEPRLDLSIGWGF